LVVVHAVGRQRREPEVGGVGIEQRGNAVTRRHLPLLPMTSQVLRSAAEPGRGQPLVQLADEALNALSVLLEIGTRRIEVCLQWFHARGARIRAEDYNRRVRHPADVVVFDELDQIMALVKVKGARNTSPAWATDVRKAALDAEPRLIPPPYFLVVARDWLYLWTTRERDCPPDQRYPTPQILGSYFQGSQTDPRTIPRTALELMVGIWLNDLAAGSERAVAPWLTLSGLPDAVASGRVEFPSAA
jgi:hypothetical protein